MPAHSKSSSAPLGLALGAGCVLAAPLFVAPGGRGAAPQVRGQPAHGEQAVEAPVEATSLPSSTAVGVAMMGAAAVAAHRGRTECQRVQGTKVACKAFENELGVQAPVGFWDPVGFTKDGDVEEFTRRRGVEVKHGRIAMLATMGYITPELTGKFPGYLSPSLELQYEDIPNGLAAISKVPQAGWAQILAYCFFVEATSDFGKSPDCGWKPPLLATDDATLKTKRLNAEIANGRLAMMAIIGMFFQDGLTGSAWGDWALYTDSPLRAFENELGVQAPVGFWDPLGLSADGDEAVFKRRRETEIKHGRVSMLATMGYITPELTGKFPGYLSPSLGLKFEDIPNGLAALSKVPLAGWFQIVLYCLYCEASGLGFGYFDAAAAEPGDKGWRPPLLATDDPELKKKRLNAEIANGRLAMMAIIGMFFQDGLTGSAWGDWSLYTDSPLRAFENELGVQAPVGFWDPLRLAADGDVNAFRRRRETEIKHGRIITPELTGKLPGELSPSLGIKYADIPNGLGAISKVPAAGWLQILLYCGFCEFSSVNAYIGKGYFDASITEPGDKGWRPPLLATDDAERKKKRLNSELANGRLAMMAIIGMFYQDGLTGSAWGDWALFTESNLRAFENELGVQAPVGFWDPLGLSADGDEAVFKRRRETEIKHGRVSMLATMGYITPELTGKFPGYLSPSLGLKYEDIPNGLAALSKVPLAGWFQIVLYCLYCEASGLGFGYFDAAGAEPGDKGWRPPLLATDDLELKKKRLNAEIANGRLAMMAIIGMFFQDGLTGSAWGDWALYTDSPLRAFENELGVQAPVGFWDPLRLAADGDVNAFRRRRETEIKHGRISMLATMGYITPELTGKLPGYLSPSLDIKYADIPNGLGAISKVPAAGWLQILLYCGFCEFSSVNAYIGKGYFDASIAEPGDKGWRPPLLATDDAERKKKRLNSEIANGRLAMMAIIGMFYQDGLTGSAWGDWALFTESNLRAFENELGVQAPVGFWDPLGLSADGDEAVFKRRRETEIKHGRVSMLATMGYITPELTGKFPGYLSPSLGLKYEDIPNGLAALSKVPLAGWFQIVLYCLYCEASGLGFGYFDAAAAEPGDKGWRPPLLATDDPELKKKRLNAEIANGRLAMMAIIGMFFQDGLTGSAWGDWALYTDSPLRAFENELGVQAPVGFWDPLRLAADGDVNAFRRRRETEIKHGRISMLATMGYITPELTGKLPGYLSPSLDIKYADIPNGLGAISKVPAAGWLQILLYCGFCEFSSVNAYIGKGYFDASVAEPGDKGWRPPLLATDDAERKTKRLNSELANGRLAMMAIIGMFYQDGLTGSAWGDWALFTESNLRAFENELGVQAPVGFWDPLGLSADGDEAVFKRRRETEIKHGRVSMLATMGYITPELTGKFPGYLSPSLGLKYEDIPNGLAALSKVPLAGWFQIVLYCLYCEASGLGFGYFDAAAAEPGDKGWRPPLLATDDAELKKKRLNAEIANGRLAMMAIIGMFFQDGLTGSAWGDWANYTDSPLR